MPQQKQEFIPFEKLDEMMKVTDPKGWIGLFSLFILIILGFIWFFFGKIPTKVNGTGMLINMGGIEAITANVSGRINQIDVKIGDFIVKDQPVANVSQFALLNDIHNQKEKILEQEKANQEKEEMRENFSAKYQEELSALKNKLRAQERLLKNGLVIEKDALETKEKITETEKRIEDLKIAKLSDIFTLNSLKRELNTLQGKYERDSTIVSLYNGQVFELEVAVGDVINPGTTLFTLESGDNKKNELQGVIYISALEAKKVEPGMKVFIIPSTVKPEEYGTMIGQVLSISSYPESFKGIMRVLHNEEVAKQILSKGTQVEVNVKLLNDNNTYSKYKWTSKDGPPIKIKSGTLCDAKITVKEKRPIEFVIPKIKEIIGIEQ